jgi:hypothetical protein
MSVLELNFLLNFARVDGIGKMLVQVYGDNAMKKTAVYKWVTRFTEARAGVSNEERSGRGQQRAELKKTLSQIMRENYWVSGA